VEPGPIVFLAQHTFSPHWDRSEAVNFPPDIGMVGQRPSTRMNASNAAARNDAQARWPT